MKSNKIRILTLAIVAVLVQSTCVYAASNKDKDEYSKDELNNLEPGFEWEDIDKSNQKVNSYINSYSSAITPKEAAENEDSSSTSTKTTTASNTTDSAVTKNVIISTQPSTGNKGDYWGKISGGKWMLIEQGIPTTGWKMVKGNWYYMDLEGIMQTGWLNYGENWYYLNSSGAMVSNTYVDGYYIDWNGVMQ
ncbi:autolysin [Clostridium puniceum]|uniref:Autolysin n=1 Tax=Clostridium puniceum TaxID=29367 RepID=A0A1S8TP71_9CLOT|nr:cell wall-binding protein [Clostridium puniceum]OOM79570.1 autolysin [Clostridium puniceum]